MPLKNELKFHISYKEVLSDSFIDEIVSELESKDIETSIFKDSKNIAHFIGPEVADIVFFIKENIYNTVLAPTIFTLLQLVIIKVWKRLSSSKKTTDSNERIIRFEIQDSKDRVIKIMLKGDYLEEEVFHIINKLQTDISDSNREKYFKSTEYVRNIRDFPTVEMVYNPETDIWSPINFDETESEFEKKLSSMLKNINN